MKSWIISLEKDETTGDLVLPLTPEILEGLEWKVNDTLEWIDNKDGTWTLRKKDDDSTTE